MSHADYCKQFVPVGGTVLDVGAGRGKFLCAMAKLGFEAFGVEINPAYIKEAEAQAQADNLHLTLVEHQAEEIPFPDGKFDFINCAEVTEHVDDPDRMCREIYRVLKPGGKCYISFHNRFGIYDYHYRLYLINWLPRSWTETVLRWLGKQKPDGGIGRQKLTTMHYYTYREVKKKLEQIGFIIKDIRAEKIKQKFGAGSALVAIVYRFLRPFYFNTFHLLLEKK